jgi:hypothetical protein
MLRDQWHQYIVAARPEARHGPCLILLHEAAIADDIGGENCRKTALSAYFGHSERLLSEGAMMQTVRAPHRGVYRSDLLEWVKRVVTLRQRLSLLGLVERPSQSGSTHLKGANAGRWCSPRLNRD